MEAEDGNSEKISLLRGVIVKNSINTLLSGKCEGNPDHQISCLLHVLRFSGDINLQYYAVKCLLSLNVVNICNNWFPKTWFSGMPKTTAGFLELCESYHKNIRHFLTILNGELPVRQVVSIKCNAALWDGARIQNPKKESFWLDCSYITQSLRIGVLNVSKERENEYEEVAPNITLKCSNLKSAEAYHTGNRIVMQELVIKSEEGCLVLSIDPLDSLHGFGEFLKVTSKINLVLIDDKTIDSGAIVPVNKTPLACTPSETGRISHEMQADINKRRRSRRNESQQTSSRRITRQFYLTLVCQGDKEAELSTGLPNTLNQRKRKKVVAQDCSLTVSTSEHDTLENCKISDIFDNCQSQTEKIIAMNDTVNPLNEHQIAKVAEWNSTIGSPQNNPLSPIPRIDQTINLEMTVNESMCFNDSPMISVTSHDDNAVDQKTIGECSDSGKELMPPTVTILGSNDINNFEVFNSQPGEGQLECYDLDRVNGCLPQANNLSFTEDHYLPTYMDVVEL